MYEQVPITGEYGKNTLVDPLTSGERAFDFRCRMRYSALLQAGNRAEAVPTPSPPSFVRTTMHDQTINLSRRTFLGSTAALAASTMIPGAARAAAAEKPDSNFNGVQIGVITYSYRSLPGTAEDLLKYITACGISSVELMGGPAEQFAGPSASMER